MIMFSESEACENKASTVAGYLLGWLQTAASLLINSIMENFGGVRNQTPRWVENFI